MQMGKFKYLSLYFIIILIVFGTIFLSKAYSATSSSISVNVIPENPSPNEDTTITLSSYADDLDSVLINWLVNGKSVTSGTGKKSFSLKAPGVGQTSAVTARVSLPAGQVEMKVNIKPTVMVMLYQAKDSYVPPFYRGKALPTPYSEVKIVAMPEIRNSSGTLTNYKNLTYSWRKDYTNDAEASGYGKNYFVYTSDYLDDSNYIEVTASTLDQKSAVASNINIETIQPKILFYKNDKNFGTMFNETIKDQHKIEDKEILVAIPYFISPKELTNPRLVWNWFINGEQVAVQGFRKNFMPLQVQSGVSGTSNLKLEIENQDKIFQKANKEIKLEF